MQCHICVTYMIFICSAYPQKDRETSTQHVKRSLFRDVIESLRFRSQIPEDFNQNEDNNLGNNYERYGFENDQLQLPNDTDFIPRRNDRIEMPSFKNRFPKSLENDSVSEADSPKKEIVVYIDTTPEPKTTQKPKKQKRPRPSVNKNKNTNKHKDGEIVDESEDQNPPDYLPWTNTMAGQSQIGNRESQMVVKPTVIVNIRGSVNHKDSDIRIASRVRNGSVPVLDTPHNIFNIKQEINLERNIAGMGSNGQKLPNVIKQDVRVLTDKERAKVDEDMMMCETATWKPKKNEQDGRKYDSVLQILFSL